MNPRLLAASFLFVVFSASASFRLDHEYGSLFAEPSAVCYRDGAFYLKAGAIEVCLDRDSKHVCPANRMKSVLPMRREFSVEKICVKWRHPKGSSPVCEKSAMKTVRVSREHVSVEYRKIPGSKYPEPVRVRSFIEDCAR